MTFQNYQEWNAKYFKEHKDQNDRINNWLLGISGESGELINTLKHVIYHQEPFTEQVLIDVAKEIGDTLWYLTALCSTLGLDFETVACLNREKLTHRHGKNFSLEKSKNRHNIEKNFKDTQKYRQLIKQLKTVRFDYLEDTLGDG